MKHGEWRNEMPADLRMRLSWSGADMQRAWAEYFMTVPKHQWPRRGSRTSLRWGEHGNDFTVVTIARNGFRKDFDALSALSIEELEALRSMAERGAFMWSMLTVVLSYIEHGRPEMED